MITPTAKAESLPPDLKAAWAELMGDKFPMTQKEAAAYIAHKYPDLHIRLAERPTRVIIEKATQAPRGTYDLSDPSFRSYWSMVRKNGNFTVPAQEMQTRIDSIEITEFKTSSIDKKLKGFK